MLLRMTAILISFMWLFPVQADWQMHEVKSFAKVAERAKQENIPVVIFFSRVRCGACDKLKENALLPLVENGIVEEFIEIVEIRANANETVLDFDGQEVPNSEMAELYNVTTFPNMVFVNSEGDDLDLRMNNSGAYDYFSFYFKQRINQALAKLENPKRMSE
ncbi:MAG: thioredoxin fold domain-containing protein [Pseudomonadota bacterium]|nr:thioredoxin fold domain-containing protein [Pseudomonadota bacterium]